MKNHRNLLCVAVALILTAFTANAGEAVQFENATHATRCAEEDNVYVKLTGAAIEHFTITAMHPAYAGGIATDRTAPDFANCDQSHDPAFPFTPKDLTLYEDADYALVGHSFGSFWRPESVDFRVGNKVTRGLHLVQLIRKTGGRRIEILVLYPADGYWRVKPLPPHGIADTAYGSSFLIGPIEEEKRPFVRLSSILFDPKRLEFRLGFATGAGTLRVVRDTPTETRLSVTLPKSHGTEPFAALRSMFVSAQMADTAEVVLNPGHRTLPIAGPFSTAGTEAIFARSLPSQHNTSAPDIGFGDFAH
jgi:hypothetical protein